MTLCHHVRHFLKHRWDGGGVMIKTLSGAAILGARPQTSICRSGVIFRSPRVRSKKTRNSSHNTFAWGTRSATNILCLMGKSTIDQLVRWHQWREQSAFVTLVSSLQPIHAKRVQVARTCSCGESMLQKDSSKDSLDRWILIKWTCCRILTKGQAYQPVK